MIKDRKFKQKSKDTQFTSNKSKEKSKISCFQCGRPGHVQEKCPLNSTFPVCGETGHTADQRRGDSRALVVLDSKLLSEEEEMVLDGMVTVRNDSGDCVKVSGKCSQGMSHFGSRVSDSVEGCDVLSHVNCALLAADDYRHACNASHSKRKTYSAKCYGRSYT